MTTNRIKRISYLGQSQLSYQKRYNFMAEPLVFQTNDHRLIEIADEVFGRFSKTGLSNDKPLIIRLMVEKCSVVCVNNQIPSTVKPVYQSLAHLFSIYAGPGSYATVELKSGLALGSINPKLLENREFIRRHFIETLGYCLLGMARNYVAVHAACVVKDGVSILLQGRSGDGKSTLAIACARQGYQVLAEDVVFVKSQNGEIRLWGAPWRFHLLPEAIEYFPELHKHGEIAQSSVDAKIEFDIEEIFPGSTITSAAAGIIVVLSSGGDSQPCIEKVSKEQVIKEFEFIWPWETGWNEHLEATSRTLLERDVYHLYLNGTPDEAVKTLDGLVEQKRAI